MGMVSINKKITGWKLEKSKTDNKNLDDNRPSKINYSLAPKRPTVLPCEIKKAKINGEAWIIIIGMLDGKPYEIFGGLSKYIDIPNKHKTGQIIKNGKVDGISTYNLSVGEDDDVLIIKDIASVFENLTHSSFTRTISLALRHGAPVQYIVEQLQKDKHSDITSFSKVIARVLKQYIVDGTKPTSDKVCPSCNESDGLRYQAGCIECSCGWSKCS